MNRQEKLMAQSNVFDAWVAKYEKMAGFNSENRTVEQERDYFAMLAKAYGTSDKG